MRPEDEIEQYFREGIRAMEDSWPSQPACPYPDETLCKHWWSYGLSYAARLLRALDAEERCKKLRTALQSIAGLPSVPFHGDVVDCGCNVIAMDALTEEE